MGICEILNGSAPSPPKIDRGIDTMLRSIFLFYISGKPAIQGICPVGVFKILCIAGFFCVEHWTNNMRVTKIHKQYKNIDVLVQIDDIYIVIEDKTFTGTHDDQINRYKKTLVDEGIAPQHIICVYYKIEEQPFPESDVDFEFTRDILLDIFRPYKNIIINSVFSDYLDYLEWIEFEINSYQRLPISEWSYRTYVGFFKHLSNTILKSERKSWGYVSNPTGGFMGLWWFDILSSDDLAVIGLDTVPPLLSLRAENCSKCVRAMRVKHDKVKV